VYHWETERHSNEPWATFVSRCAEHTIEAARVLPGVDEVAADLAGQVLYNLTWVSEVEYGTLRSRAV
jgi:hypothetical protein